MSDTIRAMPRMRPARRQRRPRRLWVPLAVLIVVLLLVTPGVVNLLVTYWWFGELGYQRLHHTVGRGLDSWPCRRRRRLSHPEEPGLLRHPRGARAGPRARPIAASCALVVNGALAVLALFLGLGISGDWQRVLFALHQAPFGTHDPVFHHDIAFYVFTLPLLQDMLGWLGLVLVPGARRGAGAALCAGSSAAASTPCSNRTSAPARSMGGPQFDVALAASLPHRRLVLAGAAGPVDRRLELADALQLAGLARQRLPGRRLRRPARGHPRLDNPDRAWRVLVALDAAGQRLCHAPLGHRRRAMVAAGCVAWVLLVGIYPGHRARAQGQPRAAGRRGAADCLQHRRHARRLRPATCAASSSSLPPTSPRRSSPPTVPASIRCASIDPTPFTDAAQQQQAIRTYYDFTIVGPGPLSRRRATAPGVDLTARAEPGPAPSTAQTWQNLNFTYTHGYGVVVAPVNAVVARRLAAVLDQRYPAARQSPTSPAASCRRSRSPRIYFGLDTNNSVFVETGASEFDYGTDYQEYLPPLRRDGRHPYRRLPASPGLGRLLRLAGPDRHVELPDLYVARAAAPQHLRPPRPRWRRSSPTTAIPTWCSTTPAAPTGSSTATPPAPTTPTPSPTAATRSRRWRASPISATPSRPPSTPITAPCASTWSIPSDAIVRTIGNAFPGLLRPFSRCRPTCAHTCATPKISSTCSPTSSRATIRPTRRPGTTTKISGRSRPIRATAITAPLPPYYAVTRLPGNATDEFVADAPLQSAQQDQYGLAAGRSLRRPALWPARGLPLPAWAARFWVRSSSRPTCSRSPSSARISRCGTSRARTSTSATSSSRRSAAACSTWNRSICRPRATRIPQLQRVITYANGKLVWGSSLDNALGQIFGTAAPPPPAASTVHTTTVPLTGTGA